MHTCISSHGLKRSWRSCPRRGECRQEKHTQHAPSTKTECDYLNGWIKKTVTYAKISPESGEPQRYSLGMQKKVSYTEMNITQCWAENPQVELLLIQNASHAFGKISFAETVQSVVYKKEQQIENVLSFSLYGGGKERERGGAHTWRRRKCPTVALCCIFPFSAFYSSFIGMSVAESPEIPGLVWKAQKCYSKNFSGVSRSGCWCFSVEVQANCNIVLLETKKSVGYGYLCTPAMSICSISSCQYVCASGTFLITQNHNIFMIMLWEKKAILHYAITCWNVEAGIARW